MERKTLTGDIPPLLAEALRNRYIFERELGRGVRGEMAKLLERTQVANP